MQVEGELRERIAPSVSLVGGYALVPAGKHDGLKNDTVDFVYVLNRESDNIAKAVVVDAVGHGNLKRRSHSGRSDVQVTVTKDRKSTRLNSSHITISYAV